MAKISITQEHNKPVEEIRERLEELNDKFSKRFGLTSSWISDNEARVERSGSKGTIKFTDETVTIELDLAFALSPLKGIIERAIRDEFARSL